MDTNSKTLKNAFSGIEPYRLRQETIFSAIDGLMDNLSHYTHQSQLRDFGAEEHLRESFEGFLDECDFQMGIRDFYILLEETSGAQRDNGDLIWTHHLVPILLFLSKVRDGTIPLDLLEEYGGLESVIRIHLRHDSLEDKHINPHHFERNMRQAVEDNAAFEDDRKIIENHRNGLVYNGVTLMSKKGVMLDKNNNMVRDKQTGDVVVIKFFDNDKAFNFNMLTAKNASPISWMLKQLDHSHNQCTLDTPKFSVQKRLKKANNVEDMFGPRHGFADIAVEKWPQFKDAIQDFDALLGSVVYMNMGDLEYVEMAYSKGQAKFKDGDPIYPSGITRFLDAAMNFNVPPAFHPVHIWLDNEMNKRDHHANPNVRARTEKFLERSIYPALKTHHEFFPRIFTKNFPANDSVETHLGL